MSVNVQGVQESVLVVFGGVVSEVNAFDEPSGSSPVCCDMDFTVASAKTRDGLQQVYAYAGNSQTRTPGVGSNNASSGTIAWTNPNNITFATASSVAVTSGALSELLQASNFGFTIPATSFIQGVQVTVTGFQSANGASVAFDGATQNGQFGVAGLPPPYTIGTLTPNATDIGIVFATAVNNANLYANIDGEGPTGWTCFTLFGVSGPPPTGFSLTGITTATTATLQLIGTIFDWYGCYCLLQSSGGTPTVSNLSHANVTGNGSNTVAYGSNVTAGDALLACVQISSSGTAPGTTVPTDTVGTSYTLLAVQTLGPDDFAFDRYIALYGGLAPASGANTITYSVSNFTAGTGAIDAIEINHIAQSSPLAGFTITPNFPVAGAESDAWQFGTLSGSRTFGGVSDLWGMLSGGWNLPAVVNAPNFGFSIQASQPSGATVTFDVSNVVVTVYYTPPMSTQFDYIKSMELSTGDTLTLALDSTGVFWQEDIQATPNVLTPFYTAIEPNTFARSVTEDAVEYIALSNLTNGTDMPRQYNGRWVDRISQVGPGAAPSVSFSTTSYNVSSITQPAAQTIGGATGHGGVQWTSGVNSRTPGNVIIPYMDLSTFLGTAPNLVKVGSVVYLQLTGAGLSAGNGTYLVSSTGSALGMESGDGESFNYFTVTGPSTQQLNVFSNSGGGVGTYQLTLATLTVSAPIPGLTVGGQITIAGASPAGWNGTWTISNVVNGATLQINTSQITSDVATYTYTLVSGTAPSVGQFVTITGCTNGVNPSTGQSPLNVALAKVSAASPGTFSVAALGQSNIVTATELNAFAVVAGTVFQFDPGLADVGTATNPIIGNAGAAGTIVIAGGLGAGLRQAVQFFITRNAFITAPSPPVFFNLTANANLITVSNLLIGPPNVIARGVAFTGANGGFFFYMPKAVTTMSATTGQQTTYGPTIVNDNTTTSATFNFTDALLLASTSIDSQGNNLFAQVELGSSLGITAYSQRLFAWGEQNKITNLINYSFDGGYNTVSPTTAFQPAGWTLDASNTGGGSLVISPLFGNAYQFSNTTGSTQATFGMITQTAYQDYLKQPIILVQTPYSVRVTAECAAPIASGNLVIDLYSPSFGTAFGTFSLPLSSLTTTMQIFTGTLLTTAFTTSVPPDLLLRVWAQNIPNNATVTLDRFEPFPTQQPVLTTQLRGSYFDNFEAFDGVTGNLGVGEQNQQPVINTFELFDTLYVIRSQSMASTADNGVSEPGGWTVREVSNKVGTPSVHGCDSGEGWALICGEPGLYLFAGGEPIKINPELDGNPGIWQTITWSLGQKMWCRNDTEKRKIYIGVCLPTPNQWMPRFPLNSAPTQPNVVLMCNYKELMSSGAISNEGPVRLTYTGELKSYALGRKWSAWSVQACYADFVERPTTAPESRGPIFFCSDQGPNIFQQITGLYSDNGAAMHCNYITYGFPKTSEAQALQMGVVELEAKFMTMLIQGSGNLQMTAIPDSLTSTDAQWLYPEPLFAPPQYDTEIPLNVFGNRFFMELYVTQPGEWFEISRMVMAIAQSAWMPVRGSNS